MAALPVNIRRRTKAPWSAQGRCRALLPARSDRAAGSHAKRTRASPFAKRTRDAQQVLLPRAHERTYGRAIRTNPSLTPLPNEPETRCSRTKTRAAVETKRTRASARPVQPARAPRRGHGFPRSHGPHEQRVNGEWLMNRYRRPKTGGIRNGALRTKQGRSRNPNEPEPAATEGTRERAAGLQNRAHDRTRHPNDPEPRHRRTNPASRTRPHEPLPPTNPTRGAA